MTVCRLYDRAGVATATAGTGTVTLGAAISNAYFTFAGAGVQDQDTVRYVIDDGNDFEIGEGVYTASGTTLTRATVIRSNVAGVQGASKLNLSGSATVRIDCSRSDLIIASMFDPALVMVNGTIVASVASNILTVSIKTLAGADPSPLDPVWFFFRNPTAATGDYSPVKVTAALNITTNAVGATLGTANAVPFRLWVTAFNNAGAVVLALWQSVTGGASPTAVAALNEASTPSTTAMSGTATGAGIFYTPNGTTSAGKAFRIIGYLDYASGLTTAGTYASAPTTVQLFGPGIKKPGDTVQVKYLTGSTVTTSTSTSFANAGDQLSISPTAAPNLINAKVFVNGLQVADSANYCQAKLFRGGVGGTQVGSTGFFGGPTTTSNVLGAVGFDGLDAPGTTSLTTYQGAIASFSSGKTVAWGNAAITPVTSIRLEEIMA
jgi:hypothetical protein